MKKLTAIVVFTLISFTGFSQVKLGLKASPNFSWNRITETKDDSSSYFGAETDGLKMRFGATVFLDFEFADNYAVTTGIGYTTKGSGYKISRSGIDTTIKMSLQYLEIPIGLKLFTNEVGTDMRMYFEVGVVNNINIGAKLNDEKTFKDAIKDETINSTKTVNFYDLTLNAGAGIEMQMGDHTWVLAGLRYNRGFFNIDANYYDVDRDGYSIKNDYLAVEVGLKF